MLVGLLRGCRCYSWVGIAIIAAWWASAGASDPLPRKPSTGPLSPSDELATFQIAKGFRVELVACEPEVVDPVAIAFDENGRMFVAEMRGYPNDGVATGNIHTGKIKLLEDRDGDGFFEHATTYADGLRFPTSVMPWKGGLLAAVAPDIIYFEDTDGAGRANRHRSLYTDFNLTNIQQLVNSLQWGLDNWVYGCAGYNGGAVRSVEKPGLPAVNLQSRGIRFHPDQPGSLEATSGGGQFGLAPDDWGQWFTATNNQHLRHIILPDHYLRRNPSLPVTEVTLDIPDHGAACKVNRISPFENWRVERTRRRRESPDANRYPSTELFPGGYITSSCSPIIYTADRFPAEFRGDSFVCDPANNLIHSDKVVSKGATFVAMRTDETHEFLASTDTWFRPVNLCIGPDGGLYILDFYREAIENPVSLPEDIKKNLNLQSRGRGRIWRIVPEGKPPHRKPALGLASADELVKHLEDPNPWWRLTAQRLLVERMDATAVPALEKLARQSNRAVGRVHALWTLEGIKELTASLIQEALTAPEPEVREQGLRLSESRLRSSPELLAAVVRLAEDSSPRVRFQLAFTLGEAEGPKAIAALATIARRDVSDPWTQMAVLSSLSHNATGLLENLGHDSAFLRNAQPVHLQFLTRVAGLVGAQSGDGELARALKVMGSADNGIANWQSAILEGLGQGRLSCQRPLNALWETPPAELKSIITKTRAFFDRAASLAKDEKSPLAKRASAVRLLAYGPYSLASPTLTEFLNPRHPADLQLAAIRALSLLDRPGIAGILLAPWATYSPGARREVLEALFASPDRLMRLLDAFESKTVLAGQIEPFRLNQLRKHADEKVRGRALHILAGMATPDRKKIIEEYRAALNLPGDALRGKAVFKKTCATCHRLDNEGIEVGPDLLSALRNKTREGLLGDILDPSREVDPRYINYIVTNKAGRTFTGMIAAETGSSITLRRAEKAEDTLLRSQIDEILATAKSLMPEGLEMQLSKQDIADVIAYLQSVATPK